VSSETKAKSRIGYSVHLYSTVHLVN